MLLSIFPMVQSPSALKCLGKIKIVCKSNRIGYGRHGQRSLLQQLASLLDPVFRQVFLGDFLT